MTFIYRFKAICKYHTDLTQIALDYPVDTRRRFNVYKTSRRRHRRRIDILWALKRRRVSLGNQ